jgi:hypothetical protein
MPRKTAHDMTAERRKLEIAQRAQELSLVFVSGNREHVADRLLEVVSIHDALALAALVTLFLDGASRDSFCDILLARVGIEQ